MREKNKERKKERKRHRKHFKTSIMTPPVLLKKISTK
jgi:hypothetical protein